MSSMNPESTVQDDVYAERPFDLDLLPDKLLTSVFEKLDYREYARIRQTSKSMNDFSENHSFSLKCRFYSCEVTHEGDVFLKAVPIRFPNYVPWKDLDPTARLHIAIASINCPPTSQKALELIELSKDNTIIESIKIYNDVTCKLEELELLLTVTKCDFFVCTHFMGAEYFTPEVMKRSMEVVSNFSDKQLLQLRGDHIRFTNDSISAEAVNTIIKEWKSGQRKISEFVLKFESTKGQRDLETILDGIEANPIWTPELHEMSEIGQIPLEDLVGVKRCYCLWRSEDVDDARFLIISDDEISFIWWNEEKRYLLDSLSEEQRDVIIGE